MHQPVQRQGARQRFSSEEAESQLAALPSPTAIAEQQQQGLAEPAGALLNEPAHPSERDAFVPTPLPSPCSHFSIKGISLRGARRRSALVLRAPSIAGTAPRRAFVSTRLGAAGGRGWHRELK